jgi:hypothetical protein
MPAPKIGSTSGLYKLNKVERAAYMHERDIEETGLTHVRQVTVDKKDFCNEVRAPKDIKNFVDNSEVCFGCLFSRF